MISSEKKLSGWAWGVLFAGWTWLVVSGSSFIKAFDQVLYQAVKNNNVAERRLVIAVTQLGNSWLIYLAALAIALYLGLRRRWRGGILMVASVLLANGTNELVKSWFRRPRPHFASDITAGGFSYPSGHSCLTMVFALVAGYLLLPASKRRWALLFPLAIGFTRMYLHVHYPSDVIGGWLEGLFLGWLFTRAANLLN
ncbi:phosphatase PAP2 family protein [Lactobacillus sp.]|uniref:phosphatase PAP2 family protein n=1 Tax=Lactobacillus sp. TaxID=1591 RepID=UPI003EF17C49